MYAIEIFDVIYVDYFYICHISLSMYHMGTAAQVIYKGLIGNHHPDSCLLVVVHWLYLHINH